MKNGKWKMKKAIHLKTFAFVLSENLPLKGAGERGAGDVTGNPLCLCRLILDQNWSVAQNLPLSRSPALPLTRSPAPPLSLPSLFLHPLE
jgi:hypothetical protein